MHRDDLYVQYNPTKEHELLLSSQGVSPLIRVMDVRKLHGALTEFKGHFTTPAVWSPCGTLIAAGLHDRIGFWDTVNPSASGPSDSLSAVLPSGTIKWNEKYLLAVNSKSSVLSYFQC